MFKCLQIILLAIPICDYIGVEFKIRNPSFTLYCNRMRLFSSCSIPSIKPLFLSFSVLDSYLNSYACNFCVFDKIPERLLGLPLLLSKLVNSLCISCLNNLQSSHRLVIYKGQGILPWFPLWVISVTIPALLGLFSSRSLQFFMIIRRKFTNLNIL